MPHQPHRRNAPGAFYVEDGCCTACGVPELLAPHLFGTDQSLGYPHCFVRRQPENAAETNSMLRVIATQELGCIRYAGTDSHTLRRIVEMGEGSQCDVEPPPGITPVHRDHASFQCVSPVADCSVRFLLERLVRYFLAQPPEYKTTPISVIGDVASLSVSWFEDHYHRVELRAPGSVGERWTLHHLGPVRLSDTLHDWLTEDDRVTDVRWQTRAQWEDNGAWQEVPW